MTSSVNTFVGFSFFNKLILQRSVSFNSEDSVYSASEFLIDSAHVVITMFVKEFLKHIVPGITIFVEDIDATQLVLVAYIQTCYIYTPYGWCVVVSAWGVLKGVPVTEYWDIALSLSKKRFFDDNDRSTSWSQVLLDTSIDHIKSIPVNSSSSNARAHVTNDSASLWNLVPWESFICKLKSVNSFVHTEVEI